MPSRWRTHCVIPDTQCKPSVNSDHLKWIGNYLADKRPDVIVHLGDHNDLPSLSSYAVGRAEAEGTRYADDIENGKRTLAMITAPFKKTKYRPELHLTLGNHEHRIAVEASKNPRLIGKVNMSDLGYRELGWTVHPFLEIATIDGISYSHYFVGGVMSRPVSSAAALLRTRHCSATMGHIQRIEIAVQPWTQKTALFAGICYTHQEDYLTVQNQETRRGIWIKHEVRDGVYDVMFVSLDYLKRKWS